MKVRIFEIFTSVEGEGILYGTKTLFVRLAGCPFSCGYCDTLEALPANSGTEHTITEAQSLIDDNLSNHTFKVNFTGGEPLTQYQEVAVLAQYVQTKKVFTYLESSCYNTERFLHVLPYIDYVKIEFKTPDSGFVDRSRYDLTQDEAIKCLEESTRAGKTTYVKVVVGERTTPEYIKCLSHKIFEVVSIKNLSGFIIQPVHGAGAPSLQLLLQMYDQVYPVYQNVRILPQLHKYLGMP